MTNIVIKYTGLVSSLLYSLLGGFHLLKMSTTKSQESFFTSTLCCSQGCNAQRGVVVKESYAVEVVQGLVQDLKPWSSTIGTGNSTQCL